MIDALNDTIRDIRNYILDLRPRRFGGDLESGLARLVREFQANTMVDVSLQLPKTAVSNRNLTVLIHFSPIIIILPEECFDGFVLYGNW